MLMLANRGQSHIYLANVCTLIVFLIIKGEKKYPNYYSKNIFSFTMITMMTADNGVLLCFLRACLG